ncbi:MAG TPA: acetate kinase [Thermomicrobiales bacterium]|nr:acetate kinase [Thermomicrobiales bacterium]
MTARDRILVFNAGSSSLKVGLFDGAATRRLDEKAVAWRLDELDPAARAAIVRQMLGIVDCARVAAVGHRVVHGGMRFTRSVRVDAAVRAGIAALAPLAPLHNPAALDVIDAVAGAWPDIPQIAAFDTAFHQTLAPAAYLYAVPYAWHTEWGIRRFGFHGLSHAYCAGRAAEMLDRPVAELRTVTCHLGSGCSLAAVDGGRSVATTMGFTPLDGLMMATRPGSLDPGILTFLLARGLLTADELDDALQHRSGLRGISGIAADMRDILAARANGHERAGLAFDLFVARLREGIAAMAASLGGLGALVFSGGVGENSSEIRAAVCATLGWMNISLDPGRNEAAAPDVDIATGDSPTRVLVIRTREDLMVARETARLCRRDRA